MTTVRTAEAAVHYTIDQLMQETGFPRRTISYYVTIGVVPKAFGAGPGAYYTDEHLRRLMLIRRAKDQNRTLADVAEAAMIRRASRRPR